MRIMKMAIGEPADEDMLSIRIFSYSISNDGATETATRLRTGGTRKCG
jgi:hypothetical protein